MMLTRLFCGSILQVWLGEQTSPFLLPNSLWNSDHLEDVEADKDEYGAGEVGLQHFVPLLAVPLLQHHFNIISTFFFSTKRWKRNKKFPLKTKGICISSWEHFSSGY